LIAICLLAFFGHSLSIFNGQMFEFHDASQPARIQQFTLNIKTLHIPPRLAPDISFGMGMPVFNFYAPTAYWITSAINLLGFSVIDALKLSFLMALLGSFVFAFLFLRNHFKWYESLLGSVMYSTSLYFAVDIFVRGNLAETWFMTLFPLALHMLQINSKKFSYINFFLTILVTSLFLTSHNILSLIAVPILLVFISLLPEKKRNLYALILGLLLAAYYFIPLIIESVWVQAKHIAIQTDYSLHYLCPSQLWNSPWGFGGSAPGCSADGFSFKLGKPQIIGFAVGLVIFIWRFFKSKKRSRDIFSVFFILLTLGSLFLTTYLSSFIWNIFSPMLSVVQFPWRFISFSLLGIAYISASIFSALKIKYIEVLILAIVLLVIVVNGKYFYRQGIDNTQFVNKYLSPKSISEDTAYTIPEYISIHTDQTVWKNIAKNQDLLLDPGSTIISDTDFSKKYLLVSDNAVLPIQYFPFWEITIDDEEYYPKSFDDLGRPVILNNKNKFVTVEYKETSIEHFADIVSIATFLLLIINLYPLWMQLKNKSKKK
jgi:hypothetical protein